MTNDLGKYVVGAGLSLALLAGGLFFNRYSRISDDRYNPSSGSSSRISIDDSSRRKVNSFMGIFVDDLRKGEYRKAAEDGGLVHGLDEKDENLTGFLKNYVRVNDLITDNNVQLSPENIVGRFPLYPNKIHYISPKESIETNKIYRKPFTLDDLSSFIPKVHEIQSLRYYYIPLVLEGTGKEPMVRLIEGTNGRLVVNSSYR